MNTQAAVILGLCVLGAAALLSFGAPGARAPETPDASPPVDASAPDAAEDRAEHRPMLAGAGSDPQLARLARELAEAQAEIRRLQERMPAEGEAAPAASPGPQEQRKRQARFFELGRLYSDGTATPEQAAELMRLAQDTVLMRAVVADLKTRIAENPDDIEARLQLVDVQSARVHSAQSITERSLLREGVRGQIDEVLKRDPDNWDARYIRAVGISHSQRTPKGRADAIGAFESLIVLQAARAAEPRFARTYGQVAGVYLAEKNPAKARAAIRAGLDRYPESEELRALLAKLPPSGG